MLGEEDEPLREDLRGLPLERMMGVEGVRGREGDAVLDDDRDMNWGMNSGVSTVEGVSESTAVDLTAQDAASTEVEETTPTTTTTTTTSPISAQQMFHLVFVLDRPDPSSAPPGSLSTYYDVLYRQVALKLTAALFVEQGANRLVENDCDLLDQLRSDFYDLGHHGGALRERVDALNAALGDGLGADAAALSLAAQLQRTTSWDAAHAVVIDALLDKTAAVLMLPREELDPTRDTVFYGLDSLVSIEIRNWITREFGAALQILDLLSSGSFTSLADTVLKKTELVSFDKVAAAAVAAAVPLS